jgi:aspartate aminotransferase
MTDTHTRPGTVEPAVTNPIFAMAARAAALRAAGADVITLAAGEPETATAAHVVAAAVAAVQDPATHHYGTAAGLPQLREHIAAQTSLTHQVPISPSDVQVTVGTKHALHLAMHAVTAPGDDVLVLRPGWPGHAECVQSIGANAVFVPTGPDFLVTPDALAAARTDRTRALILANPSNPTGAVHRPEQLAKLAQWCWDNDIWLICDEVYDAFVYDVPSSPALALAPHARSRIVVANGVSKVHAMTGWRVGWVIGPTEVVTSAREHVARTITHVPQLNQAAALAAVADQETPRLAAEQYRRGRDLLGEALNSIPGVECAVPDGGMFAFPRVADLIAAGQWSGTDELAQWLLEHAHVAVVPGTAFGSDDHLRISFAVDHERLGEAARRLASALS